MSKGNGNSELSRELKDLIDRVVVPALVREYLGEIESKNLASPKAESVADFATSRTAPSEEGG